MEEIFEYTAEGYLKAKAYLQEIKEWERVSSSGLSTDGFSIIHEANSIWNSKSGSINT